MSGSPRFLGSPRHAFVSAALLGAGLLVTVAGCSSTAHQPPSAGSATSPEAVLASATADARAQAWVHVLVTDRKGTQNATIAQDSGPEQGQQNIQLDGVIAKVVLVNGNAYIQGNSQAVTNYFGLPAADGPTLAGRWISISPSDSAYTTVTAGVSLASVLQEIGLTGNLTETARTTRDGQAVMGIEGTASSPDAGGGTATLYITTSAHPLPVEFDTASSQGTEQAVFSDWGKPVSLSAPSQAIPFSSIPSS